MERKPIRLILCDFDGTLVDTRMANALAYIETLREVGIELGVPEYLATYFGMRCNEFMTVMGITDPTERERLRLRKIELYPHYFHTLKLNEPLWQFAQSVRRQGGKLWIVSTGSPANINNVINHLGLQEGIDGIDYYLSISDKLAYDADVSPYIGYSLRPMLILARAILSCALARTESRGAHIREDHPETSEEFCCATVVEYASGSYRISFEKEDAQ